MFGAGDRGHRRMATSLLEAFCMTGFSQGCRQWPVLAGESVADKVRFLPDNSYIIPITRVRIGRHPFGYMDTPLGYRDTLLRHVTEK